MPVVVSVLRLELCWSPDHSFLAIKSGKLLHKVELRFSLLVGHGFVFGIPLAQFA